MDDNVSLKPLDTAVLLLIFNRPEMTGKVFDVIRSVQPKRLYIGADGPRPDRKDDAELVEQARQVVENVDWDCVVKRLYQDDNLGCRNSVTDSITWFFEHEEDGIILEDDCLPSQSFFGFCEQMLERYRDDSRIMMISGNNYKLDSSETVDDSYLFCRNYSCWGWATWKRGWDKFDRDLSDWNDEKLRISLNYLSAEKYVQKHYRFIFDLAKEDTRDIWDYQWQFACIFNYSLCIVPQKNMISNIGTDGVHFSGDSPVLFRKRYEIDVNRLKHPGYIYPDLNFEDELYRTILVPNIKRMVRRDSVIRKLKVIGIYSLLKNTRDTLLKK